MERLMIFVGRPNKSRTPTNCFFKVPIVGRFMPLIGVIRRPVESPLHTGSYPIPRIMVVVVVVVLVVGSGGVGSGADTGFRKGGGGVWLTVKY